MPIGSLDQVRINESQLRQITENMMIMISQVTVEGIYISVSFAHQTILGYEPHELLNHSVFDYIHPEDKDRVEAAFYRGLLTGAFTKTDFRYRCADGNYYCLETVGTVLRDDNGKISGAVLGSKDISARKKMEDEISRLEQLHMVGEMAASIAHEIRNPMTTVRGFLQLLSEKEGCRDNKEYFDVMIEEIDSANALISEFLSMAKVKKINYAMHDLNQVVKAIYPLLEADAIKSDKQINLNLEEIPDLFFDARELRQLIINLVRNGLESMEPGGKLTIRTVNNTDKVILSIEDQGHGIAADILEKLGTPFFTTKDFGTGLGLAICYSIAARNNATIEVKTNVLGSTFSVVFKHPDIQNKLTNKYDLPEITMPDAACYAGR